MKKTILISILAFFFASSLQAQNLSKEETVKYIETFYLSIVDNVASVTLEPISNVLLVERKDNIPKIRRVDLKVFTSFYLKDESIYGMPADVYVMRYGELESDGQRMIRALTHLQKLIKEEGSADPFGND